MAVFRHGQWAQSLFKIIYTNANLPCSKSHRADAPMHAQFCIAALSYLGVGNVYLISSNKLQIGIGIGKFSVINSEELQIGKL